MLLVGTCNPSGECHTYNGLRYTQDELSEMVKRGDLCNVPVKNEHTGANIGSVVSGFLSPDGALQCVMQIDENHSLESAIAAGFVRDGIAADLSLGYTVDVSQSKSEKKLKAGEKKLLEISVVRRGAREHCHIQAYEDAGHGMVYVRRNDPWSAFDMH